MSCKEICEKHRSKRKYENGGKYCKTCTRYIIWDGIFCPCCGLRVRGKRACCDRNNARAKKRLQRIKAEEEEEATKK